MELILGLLCFGLPLWILFGIVAGMIGAKKGDGFSMFVIGVLLGPFGILIALFSPGNRKTCPHCRELIDKDATVCSHCHRDQPKPAPPRLPSVAASQSVAPTPSPTPATVADPTMPCPLCGQELQVSSLKQGENWCTHCLGKFVAE